MASYDVFKAQPPVVFPLSGSPICVALAGLQFPGCMLPVFDKRSRANLVGHSKDIRPKNSAEKFILEPSLEHEGLVHVRNCADGKYWVLLPRRRGSNIPLFISCTADEPEEDLDKPSCTLFDFRPDQQYRHETKVTVVRIFHPQQKKYASVFHIGGATGGTYLRLLDDGEVHRNLYIFSVRRLSQQKELPKYITLKGANGKYLTLKEPYLTRKDPYLQFSSSEITDPAVVHETFTDEYGVVRIKSIGSNRYWRLTENGWISADSNGAAYNDAATAFKVVIQDDNNNIAIQNFSNSKFCQSLSDQGREWLSASTDDSSTTQATFLFEEAVRSRKIYDLQYLAGGEKTYNNEGITRTEVSATNRTNEFHEAKQKITLYERKERSWNLDVKASGGFKTNFTASIPLWILDIEGGGESHLDIEGHWNWGENNINETKSFTSPSYPVPPMTRVKCSIFTREAVVNVPFSYKQKDVLYNGETLPPRVVYGGIYRGVTSSDIHVQTTDEQLE